MTYKVDDVTKSGSYEPHDCWWDIFMEEHIIMVLVKIQKNKEVKIHIQDIFRLMSRICNTHKHAVYLFV